MQDAPPIQVATNKPKEDLKFDKIESFVIDEIYNLKISFNDNLFSYEIEEINQFPKKLYNIFLNLEELGKINRYFLQFESLKEVFDSFKNLIQKNLISILKEEKSMKIKIKNPSNEKEFYMNIPLKEKDLKHELDSIIPYISSLNVRISELEKKVNDLEKKYDYCISIINEYKEKEKEEDKEKVLQGFQFSNIVNKKEQKAIYNWLNNKPKNFKLLFDSKKDGDKTSIFYEKCRGKGPTIVIIQTTEGYKFGGYTSIPWKDNANKILKDNESFIFSLNKMKKYPILKPDNAIQSRYDYFAFGGVRSEIYINNNCHSNSKSYTDKRGTYDLNDDLNGGKMAFMVSSYEVYHLEY